MNFPELHKLSAIQTSTIGCLNLEGITDNFSAEGLQSMRQLNDVCAQIVIILVAQ